MVKVEKHIKTQTDVLNFAKTKCYSDTLGMINAMSSSVKGLARSDVPPPAPGSFCSRLLDLLSVPKVWIEQIPLEDVAAQRFGNKAFRSWWAELESHSVKLHATLLQNRHEEHYEELSGYLLDSFGNATRLDFGTGHELHFIVWVRCLASLGYIVEADLPALTLHVFWEYMQLMRGIQKRYNLEPAGSHGVWGLDDFHHLQFIFGASQLIENTEYPPTTIGNERLVQDLRSEYMYMDGIAWILDNKKGPFHEHSSVLHNVSGVGSWSKICSGMVKMYQGEVLSKFPIMQHFLFGELNKFE